MTFSINRRYKHHCTLALLAFVNFLPPILCQTTTHIPVPPHGPAIVLFNGTNLSQFDTFIRGRGLNSDPEHVFQVEDGLIHISGTLLRTR